MGSVAADGGDVAAFFAAFAAGEVFVREKGGGAGGAEEDGIGFADVVFEEAVVVDVLGGDDAELDFGVCGAQVGPFGGGVEVVHDLFGAGEGAVDDVDVVDFRSAEHEGEPDVPLGLLSGAEDGDGVDAIATVEDDGCSEGSAKGGQLFCC